MTSAVHNKAVEIDVLRQRFRQTISRFFDKKSAELAEHGQLSDSTGPLLAMIREFMLPGGKYLRPLFCYWGWRGAGGADTAESRAAAASLEMLHAFALIHDDIMDGSRLRRGRPTVHQELAHLHDVSGWSGESDRFGTSMGILCGDLLMMWSDELFQHCGLPLARINDARPIIEKMRSELILGQHLDMLEQARGGSLSGALTVIRFKTAKYTVERPLQIGGVLAGADPTLLDAYTAFAVPLGEAFQLRDDELGVFGDTRITGKSTLDDLRDGKPTVLMALAKSAASVRQAEQIRRWHGNSALNETGAQILREIIVSTGARARVERMITSRVSAALAALCDAPITEEARSALRSLTFAATERSA